MPPTRASRRGPAIATAVAILAVGAATAAAVWMVDRHERNALADSLRSNLRAMVQTLDLWTADQVGGVQAVAAEPHVRESVAALVSGRPTDIERWVKTASAIRGYAGYLVTDSEWRVVASDTPDLVGSSAHFASDHSFTDRLRADGAAITHPLPSLTPRLDAKGVVRAGAPTQFVCAWVVSTGSLGGALCFRVDPLITFNVVVSSGQTGASGEAYAVDRQGRLLSTSRFEPELVATGLLEAGTSSIFNVQARVPEERWSHGRLLLSVSPTAPLTPMAQAAIDGPVPTVHLGGYPDYRGVSVVGAAQWLPALDIGLVVKRDADEALAALRYSRRAIVTLGAATVALLLATGLIFARSRRRAEASDQRQRSILDNTSAAVALKGRDGAYLVANQAWLRVLQRPESQVLGRKDEDILPFDAAARRAALERQALEGGRPVEATEDWTIDGAVRHFLTVVFPVHGESNTISGLGVISTDITTQVQSERRLQELSGNLERIVQERTAELRHQNFLSDTALDLTKAGYWHVPLDGSGWYNSSERAVRIFGDLPSPDLRYRLDEWAAHVQEGDAAAARATMENFAAAAAGTIPVYDSVYAYKRPVDGRIVWIHALGHVEKDASGKPTDMFGVTQDISDFKRLEAELIGARNVAEEASRAKADFLANMSHEIRTPMNAIIGMAHLAMKTALDAKQHDYVSKIQRAGQHLLGVINDILDFSKIESGRMGVESEDFELEAVVSSVTDFIAEKATAKGLELIVDVDAKLPNDLRGDSLRLGQVLILSLIHI